MHNVTDRQQTATDGRNTTAYARPLVRSVKNLIDYAYDNLVEQITKRHTGECNYDIRRITYSGLLLNTSIDVLLLVISIILLSSLFSSAI